MAGISSGSASATSSAAPCCGTGSASPSAKMSTGCLTGSAGNPAPAKLMRLSEVLLANLSALPGINVALATSGTYTQPLSAPLASFDRATSSWSKCQQSFQAMEAELGVDTSEAWPRSGMVLSGTAYPLAPLVRPIAGTESGLWRMPLGTDATKQGRGNLTHQVKTWPTPTSRDWKSGASNQHGRNSRPLSEVVKLWPTPNASDADKWSNQSLAERKAKGNAIRLNTAVSPAGMAGGQLNPNWVEWLMGFPIGHTALEGSETQSSRKSRSSSAGQSTKSKRKANP